MGCQGGVNSISFIFQFYKALPRFIKVLQLTSDLQGSGDVSGTMRAENSERVEKSVCRFLERKAIALGDCLAHLGQIRRSSLLEQGRHSVEQLRIATKIV